VPADTGAEVPEAGGSAGPETFVGALQKAAVWLFSGIGVAALVAALGGAALFVRFHAARIPAAEALTVVPNAELVVRGAMALALYLLLGGAAVAVVSLLDPQGRPGRRTIFGLLVVVVAEMAVPVWTAAGVSTEWKIGISCGLLAAWILGWWLLPKLRGAPEVKPGGKRVGPTSHWLKGEWRWLAVLLILGELAVAIAITAFHLYLGLTLLLAGALLAAVLRVATLTRDKSPLYAVAVFLSVVIFGAGAIAFRALEEPQARPAAALVNGHGVCGLYVTETDTRLYLAAVELDQRGDPVRRTGRIIAIPKERLTAETVGDLQKLGDAAYRARQMRDELVRGQAAVASPEDTVVRTVTRKTANGSVVEQVSSKRPAPNQAAAPAAPAQEPPSPCTTTKLPPRPDNG
jgi:hypothetical protein